MPFFRAPDHATLDRLQRDRRDGRRRSSSTGILRDVGQFEELPPRVRRAKRRRNRRRLARRIVESVEATVGVGLKNAGEPLQMPRRMLAAAIPRGVINDRRRRGPTERPVVMDIAPYSSGDRLALGQDRHRGVVAMQPLGRQDMRLDQSVERHGREHAGANLVGKRRDAEIDAFAFEAGALVVQRDVLAELVEQDRRQKLRPDEAARRRMERRRNRFAVAAGELFAHRLDHFPLARNHLQRLGDILAQFRRPAPTTHPTEVGRQLS